MTSAEMVVGAAAAWYLIASCISFATFALDKARAARGGGRRIPERTLHLLSAIGGFPGSMAAMWGIRHKNRKIGFVAVTLAIAVLHVGAEAALAWMWSRGR